MSEVQWNYIVYFYFIHSIIMCDTFICSRVVNGGGSAMRHEMDRVPESIMFTLQSDECHDQSLDSTQKEH